MNKKQKQHLINREIKATQVRKEWNKLTDILIKLGKLSPTSPYVVSGKGIQVWSKK